MARKCPRLTSVRLREKNTITQIIIPIRALTSSFTGLGSWPLRSGADRARPVTTCIDAPHSIGALIRILPDAYWATEPPSSTAKPIRCAYSSTSRRASMPVPSPLAGCAPAAQPEHADRGTDRQRRQDQHGVYPQERSRGVTVPGARIVPDGQCEAGPDEPAPQRYQDQENGPPAVDPYHTAFA